MRIAFISDIHGNSIALDAVLADVVAQGSVDMYYFLGDFVSLGYDPIGVLQRVTKLPNTVFSRGNHDRYTVTGERPGPTLEEAQAKPALMPLVLNMASNLAWTQGQMRASGWWDWLAQLSLEVRLTLPDGTRVLCVHSAPGTDDGPGIIPPMNDGDLRTILEPAEADLVIVGHTHVPLDRTVGQVRVFNLGSVSNPVMSRQTASYALLDANATHHTIQLRYVEYDREAAIDEIRRVTHPTPDFLAMFLRGEVRPPWASPKRDEARS